jgi:hypothetical protein
MKNTTGGVKYSQLRLEDYLRESRLEAEDNAGVYSNPTMYEKEGDSVKVGEATRVSGEENRLLELILSPDNMNVAYEKVKQNKGSHGIDKMTVEQLLPHLLEQTRSN